MTTNQKASGRLQVWFGRIIWGLLSLLGVVLIAIVILAAWAHVETSTYTRMVKWSYTLNALTGALALVGSVMSLNPKLRNIAFGLFVLAIECFLAGLIIQLGLLG